MAISVLLAALLQAEYMTQMLQISLTGLREDFERYKAERQKKTEPIEARVLSAILSSSATPYRQAPFVHPMSIAQTEQEMSNSPLSLGGF